MKNKEIEELLNKIKNSIKKHNEEGYANDMLVVLEFDVIEWNLLLSYIEQLKKENEFLRLDNPNANIKHFEMLKENKRKIDDLRYQNKQLEKRNKELYEGFMATQEELTDYATKNEQLENNRDKAIEILNKWEKENINPVFRKGLLKILKGDSDENIR